MKTRTKKLVSLLLTFVMLLGMIPMGAIGVFAEGTDGNLSIGENDAAGTVYTIYGETDWATVASAAAAGNTFEGKVIKLGKSFGGTQSSPITLTTLFASTDSAYRFMGEFDGNNQILSYITVSGNSLIAKATAGTVNIHDFTLSNITMTGNANSTCMIAEVAYFPSNDYTLVLNNVDVQNSVINGGTCRFIGGLIGQTAKSTYTDVTIIDCDVTGMTINMDADCAGLLIGLTQGGNIRIENSTTQGTIQSSDYGLDKVGGWIGYVQNNATTIFTDVSVKNSKTDVTIKSTCTTGANNRFAGLGFGHVSTSSQTSGTATKVLVDGCDISGSISAPVAYMGGITGAILVPNMDSYEFTVQNTKINANLTFPSDATGPSSHLRAIGGAVGLIKGSADSAVAAGNILFENVKIEGALSSEQEIVIGGVIGQSYGSEANTAGITTNITAKNCEVIPTITGGQKSGYIGTGMFVGQWGSYSWKTSGVNRYFYHTGTLSLINSVLGGSITAEQNTAALGAAIGLLGYYGGTTVNIDSSVIATAFPDNIMSTTDMTAGSANLPCAAAVIGRGLGKNARVNINNCVTTYKGKAGTDFHLASNANNMIINDANATGYVPFSDDCLLGIDSGKLTDMINYQNVNICGTDVPMIDRIGGHITGGYLQTTDTYTVTPEEGEAYTAYAVRFIALSQLDAPDNAGIRIVVKDTDGNVVKTFNSLMCKTYDTLIGYGPDGAKLPVYDATNYAYGASKFIAVVIEDIPTGTAYTFEVTPHYTTEGGLTVMGETRTAELNANGVFTNAND